MRSDVNKLSLPLHITMTDYVAFMHAIALLPSQNTINLALHASHTRVQVLAEFP